MTTFLLTLRVSLVAVAIVVPTGIAVAWVLERKRVPGRLFFEVLISLPLALTPVVIGYALLVGLGRNSIIGGFTHDVLGFDIAFTWVAAAIASAVVAFPLSVRAFMVAFASIDRRIELAARSLGAGPWRTFFAITLPLAYPGILAGILLGFARALSEFGATIIVAGNIPGQTQTLPLAIFTHISAGEDARALPLIAITVALAVISLLVHNWLLQKATRERARHDRSGT